MKTIGNSIPAVISAATICLLFAVPVFSQVSIGLRQVSPAGANLQISVQYSSCSNYSSGGLDIWNSQVFSLRWSQSLGSNVIMTLNNQAAFSFALDGPPANGGDGFFYQKFSAQGTNVTQSLNSGQVLPVLLISTSVGSDNLASFQLVTTPNAWADANHGRANVENAVLGEQFLLFNPGPPTVSQLTCSAPAQGVIQINSTNGGAMEYSINGGVSFQPSPVFNNLPAGSYSIRIRLASNNGCTASYLDNPVVIAAPSPPTMSAPALTQPTCALPSGAITVSASGTGTLQYSINNGGSWQAGNSFTGLSPGNYTILARLLADNTCVAAYSANPVTIQSPPSYPVIDSIVVVPSTLCEALGGTLTVHASPGTLSYSVNQGVSWQGSSVFSNLQPGSRHVVVRRQQDTTCVTQYGQNPVVTNLPPGCCPAPGYANSCSSGDYIDDFSMAGFSNTGSGCSSAGSGNLSVFSGMGPGVRLGENYIATVKAGPGQGQHVGLYIDFNLNGSFLDAGEFVNLGWIAAGGIAAVTVPIPITAPLGMGKLRVRSSRTAALTAADGCYTSLAFGETEDYDIYFHCPDNLAVNGVLGGVSVHSADLEITSLGKILAGASVVFKAGESVTLMPEFEVELGGLFQVSMESCY